MQHTGKAVVFENIEDYKHKIDDPDLEVDEDKHTGVKKCGAERLSRHA